MTSEAGWARHRPVGVWIMGAFSFVRMSMDRVERAREERRLREVLQTYSWSDESLYRAVMRAGRIANNSAFLDVCVKLSKLPSSAIPAYEAVSGMQLFTNVPTDSCERRILDAVYGATPLSCVEESQQNTMPTIPVVDGSPISINRRSVILTGDQRQSLAIGTTPFPIVGIQAAFGTGKTVVGAYIAAKQARGGARIILTATTNVAVAQITEIVLSLDAFADLDVCRYI
ncbi:unnamed protein product [Heligmosomoides polygyrus]|uniref:AAA_11 domain-containing protein n=1 Tax=Heligmosomoides polygyrus TaxID=6339 RepID=A0A183F3C9_HELPZ|nr:unnamed protein product [Heligmosomoides polygyrus]